MEKTASGSKAKRQFIFLYLVSIILIFLVVSAFWKASSAAPKEIVAATNDDAASFMQIDTLLHAKMEALDASIVRYVAGKRPEGLAEAQRKTYVLQKAIDSVEKQASILLEGSRKQHMQLAVANFKIMMQERNRVLYGGETIHSSAEKGEPGSEKSSNGQTDELSQLKQVLMQKDERIQALEQFQAANGGDKDKLILSLQNQLKQKDAALQQKRNAVAQPATGNETEWKQKYALLKISFEKVSATEKALQSAYKTVAEDNRRLLNQLQTLRSEKKN